MKRRRGQVTIIGILMVIVTLFALSVASPLIDDGIELINATDGSIEDLILLAVKPVLYLMVIVSILVYARPERERYF